MHLPYIPLGRKAGANASDNPNPGFGTHITGTTAPSNGFDVNPTLSASLKEYAGGNGWLLPIQISQR
jgi:hypothetical protein